MLATLERILAGLGFHADIGTFLVLFGLVLARIVLAISLAPFLGGRSVSGRIKVGLAVFISALLFPSVVPESHFGDLNSLRVMSLLVKEAVIGATLGFMSQIVFYAIQMAGAMVDYQRGMSQATFFAPQLETNVSLLGQLQFQAALVLFLLLNGHLVFLRALASSFRSVPLLDFPHFTGGTLAAVEQMARYTGDALLIALQLGAPVLLVLFLIDISFGMLGKVASGFQVHNESQPVKALVGLGVFLLGLAYILNRMPGYFSGMMPQMDQLVRHVQ
jgi:flagellar biosynthetic protein FliR